LELWLAVPESESGGPVFNFPDASFYTRDHLWVGPEEEGRVLIGVTEIFLTMLGEVEEVEYLATEGSSVRVGEILARLASDEDEMEVPSPLSGEIVRFNVELGDSPEVLFEEPYTEGWMVLLEVRPGKVLDNLLSVEEYEDFVEEQIAALDEELSEEDEEEIDLDLEVEEDEEEEDEDEDY
jgi:glycine cleavage system H protein